MLIFNLSYLSITIYLYWLVGIKVDDYKSNAGSFRVMNSTVIVAEIERDLKVNETDENEVEIRPRSSLVSDVNDL